MNENWTVKIGRLNKTHAHTNTHIHNYIYRERVKEMTKWMGTRERKRWNVSSMKEWTIHQAYLCVIVYLLWWPTPLHRGQDFKILCKLYLSSFKTTTHSRKKVDVLVLMSSKFKKRQALAKMIILKFLLIVSSPSWNPSFFHNISSIYFLILILYLFSKKKCLSTLSFYVCLCWW